MAYKNIHTQRFVMVAKRKHYVVKVIAKKHNIHYMHSCKIRGISSPVKNESIDVVIDEFVDHFNNTLSDIVSIHIHQNSTLLLDQHRFVHSTSECSNLKGTVTCDFQMMKSRAWNQKIKRFSQTRWNIWGKKFIDLCRGRKRSKSKKLYNIV